MVDHLFDIGKGKMNPFGYFAYSIYTVDNL